MNELVWDYLRRGKRQVHGWLQRIDAEIIGALLDYQEREGILGGCAEIGVHHGKSFIPLCMALRDGERALCIDLFDDQSRNLDSSGKGDLGRFEKNLTAFRIDRSRIRIFQGSSEDVAPAYVLEQVGPVRFFSVDGGHWSAIVQNDLRLAESTLGPDGVIALDDYCRAEWPDVTTGYTLWQEKTESDLVPFAVGSNKLYLCRSASVPAYRAALETPFLKRYFGKHYRSGRWEVSSYRVEPVEQDEATLRSALALTLKIFRPELYFALASRRNGKSR